MLSSLQIETPHILKRWILVLSWPWALFGSRLLIFTRKSIFVIWQDVLSICNGNLEGKALSFEIWDVAQQKRIGNLFFLENQQHLSSRRTGGIQGIFFLFNSVFKKVLKSTKIAFTNKFLVEIIFSRNKPFYKTIHQKLCYGFIRKKICENIHNCWIDNRNLTIISMII